MKKTPAVQPQSKDLAEDNPPAPWQHLLAVAALPGFVVLFIPALLLSVLSARPIFSFTGWGRVFTLAGGIILICAGLYLSYKTIILFAARGRGTLAPWHPPKNLVTAGPYRHVRNPMISAVAALLFGQAFLFSSPVVGVWALAFSAINALYIPLVEEPALAKRFGKAYLTYQQHVPRWLPRLSPWQPDDNQSS